MEEKCGPNKPRALKGDIILEFLRQFCPTFCILNIFGVYSGRYTDQNADEKQFALKIDSRTKTSIRPENAQNFAEPYPLYRGYYRLIESLNH